MTVNTIQITSGPYPGNDIADTFDYDFRVQDKTQLVVFETDDLGVETELTVDTDYTVNDIGSVTGTVTRKVGGVATPLPTGYTWYIRANYKQTQLTGFASQGGFFPDVHEDAFDKLTFLVQQIEDILGRSIRVSESYTGGTIQSLPDPEAAKFLKWKSDLSGFENAELLPGDIAVGLDVGDVVQLINVGGGTPGFPAINGSLLTNLTIDFLQIIPEFNNGLVTTTASIPLDNTKPQQSEGAEILTETFEKLSETSSILVIGFCNFSHSSNDTCIFSLYENTETDSVASAAGYVASNNQMVQVTMAGVIAGLSAGTQTINLRGGPVAGTLYVNGNSNGQRLGGAFNTGIVIIEYEVV